MNWPSACPVAKGDLELLTLQGLTHKCWDHGCVPPHLVYMMLGLEPRISCTLDKLNQLSPFPQLIG